MRFFLLAVMAPMLVAPAIAQSQQKPDSDEKKVCRREQVIGSILPGKRICHSRAEWKEIDKQTEQSARDALDQMPHRPGMAPGS